MRKSTKEEIPRDDGTTHLTGNSYTFPQNGNRPTQTDMAQSEALSPPRDSGQGRQGGREEERALGAEDAEEKRSLHTRGWRKQTRPEGGGSGIVTERERVAPKGRFARRRWRPSGGDSSVSRRTRLLFFSLALFTEEPFGGGRRGGKG